MLQVKEGITDAKEFIVKHQEGIVTGTLVTSSVAGLYAGLTMIKIKWLVLIGLVGVVGMTAGAGYVMAAKLVKKCDGWEDNGIDNQG